MQLDPTGIAEHAEGLKEPIRYIAAVLLALWLSTLAVLMKVLQTRVEQEKAHSNELMALVEAGRVRDADTAKQWLQLEHTNRAFLGCVKAGAWVLMKYREGAKLKPAPLPEDPEDNTELLAAFEAPTKSGGGPGG